MADTYKNFDNWQLYMREVTSPQNYVDFGWHYLVAAALQRRVWRGPDHRKLYPNIYPILVGEPGIGKGLVIKQVAEFLREHKLRPGEGYAKIKAEAADASTQIAKETVQAANFESASKPSDGKTKEHKPREEPLLIPVASDCVTFEALVRSCANATRACVFTYFDEKLQKKREGIYRYAALCFCLEEISSLFHKEAAKVVNFLIAAYDCGDYTYETKTQSTDYVKGLCLNFFGGTTPGFVESSFSDKLLSEGFASRTWFIFASKNRKYSLINPPLDESQLQAKADISAHLKKLTALYGEVKFTKEAWDYMDSWWKDSNTNQNYRRPNTSEKLNAYYSRKDIHLQKMAMAVHFGEDAEANEHGGPKNEITLATVLRAKMFLETEEPFMHMALNFDGANPLHKIGKKVLKFIKQHGPKTTDDLVMEFWSDATREETNSVVEHLQRSNQLELDKALRWNLITKG